jgi:DNA invertase Pin-like site-specific DNA recombinase
MAMLFCQSPRCRGHEMSPAHMLADIRRWPRERMVGPPAHLPPPRCPRSGFTITATAKRAAIARVKAGHRVATVATAMGVSRTTVYNWKMAADRKSLR